jgi:hypothetical protein
LKVAIRFVSFSYTSNIHPLYVLSDEARAMTITLPDEIGSQLSGVRGSVRVCDRAGHTLGLFTPTADIVLEPQISEEELERRSREEPLYSTEQVLAHLRSL